MLSFSEKAAISKEANSKLYDCFQNNRKEKNGDPWTCYILWKSGKSTIIKEGK